jgi:hypothetical protein
MQITPKNVSKAVDVAFAKTDHFRRARSRFLAQMVGRFYSKSTPGDREERKASPINLLYTAIQTVVPNLVYNDPKFKVQTDILPFKQYADLLGLAVNHVTRKVGLRLSLRKAITDALFMAGFMKTGLAAGDKFLEVDGAQVEIGEPFAERVSPDDMILDPLARDWEEQAFVGNRFRADLDDLLASGLYDPDQLNKLASPYDENDRQNEAERLVGDKSGQEMQEIQRYVDLVEVFIPKEQIIVTLPYQKNSAQDTFLRIADYQGPDTGPYHMLGLGGYVPDQILPVAPAGIWYDLHILGNRIARKLSRQAERIKRVLAYQGAAVEDVNEIAEADDGETVRVEDINAIKEVQYGGAGNDSYTYMEWVKRQFSEQAGNVDLLSGTGNNTPTATQAEMLQANTSVRLSDMQSQVYQFTADVGRDIIFFLHTDPLIELPLARRVGGVEQQVIYSPDAKRGDWLDFNIKTKPYSMARPDPEKQRRLKMEFATNVIPAGAQAVALIGPGFNIGAFLRSMAEDIGFEDVEEFINDDQMMQYVMSRMMMNTGDPGKAGGMVNMPQLPVNPNPNQPNPQAYAPNGGISPDTEQRTDQQAAAGQLQATSSRQPSANQLAQARGT